MERHDAMFLVDLLGTALTLLTLALLASGGFLFAFQLTRRRPSLDPLALAIASLLLTIALAVGIALVLGVIGFLRIGPALAALAAVNLALALPLRREPESTLMAARARLLRQRAWSICNTHPALAVLASHGAASEALRGIVRPPLSWDSLAYHLLLAADWLQQEWIAPVLGPAPTNLYGYMPANGSLWLWWWMAPSHSELWVNLASFPHWLLLGLATGGVARELGARRSWPVASFLVLVTPAVLRFAATQYVDILLAATLVSAAFFSLSWLRSSATAEVMLGAVGLGLAAGTKILGAVYAGTLALTLVLALGDRWPLRLRQLVLGGAIAAAFGGFFYARNLSLGAGPVAMPCEATLRLALGIAQPGEPTASTSFPLARAGAVLELPSEMLGGGKLAAAFLGSTHPAMRELGVGPVSGVLFAAALVLPWVLGRANWRPALLVAGQIWFELAFWLAVPFAANNNVFGNVRYLIPAIALAFAAAAAIADRRVVEQRWIGWIAIAICTQGLLQLHAEMPTGVRSALALVDLAVVALALSPDIRRLVASQAPWIAVGMLLLALLAAPRLAAFRIADRTRAFAQETTAHATSAPNYAGAWRWLDQYAGLDPVAVVGAPYMPFIYPAMGPRLERRAQYVNVNRVDHRLAISYRHCDPRVDPEPAAWVANLSRQRVRWVHVSRLPGFAFPPEETWAMADPERFHQRYADDNNRIFELRPPVAHLPAGTGSADH